MESDGQTFSTTTTGTTGSAPNVCDEYVIGVAIGFVIVRYYVVFLRRCVYLVFRKREALSLLRPHPPCYRSHYGLG